MANERILIVEDDTHLSKLILYNLEKAGYGCDAVDRGETALTSLEKSRADLILLDIMLPGMDGFEVCKAIKQEASTHHIPVIMLTARGEEIDRIVGLEIGADDYIVKPFSPRELILRVKAVLRRAPGAVPSDKNEILTADDLTIDIPRHKVTVGSENVVLTSMEYKLLVTLVRRRGRVQSRDHLLQDVWDLDVDVTTRTIDTHVKRLRQKLGPMGAHIETVRGHGYRFSEGL